MITLHTEGKCLYCGKMYTPGGIIRHLGAHLKAMASESPTRGQAFHVRVNAGQYFLNLLVDGKARLGDLDAFLRAIWLDCCGHLSSFAVKGKDYFLSFDIMDSEYGESMDQRVDKLFYKGLVLVYQYDFGSTTRLEIKVTDSFPIKAGEKITLLSRNEPLPILCDRCDKNPAEAICSIHIYEGENCFFCENCARQHAKECEDFADYAAMPVVNSPRVGTCGYTGGMIDEERDGVWAG